MPVTLSEKAAREVKRLVAEQKLPNTTVLRVGVTGGGCSGFQYSLGLDRAADEKADLVAEFHGVQLAVNKKGLSYLDGTEIDFHEGLDHRGFVFNNPNVKKSCGCGSSFEV
ncbi:MAG TPA: iron-sulfur cluster assembly accessory protein [Rhodocyclaceae bacterium]|jgi:iron-sulfur cluster assembly protein|nr:iron-sulfur cluster assembly accessory protein [Rhodocyclaceae bacterium]